MAGLDPAIQSKWHGRLDTRVKPAHEGEFFVARFDSVFK
jgi:hypothetical protein